MHFNLHKTFTHAAWRRGTGLGTGGGKRAVGALPARPLPVLAAGDAATVLRNAWSGRSTPRRASRSTGIGPTASARCAACLGNFGCILRAYAYIRANGGDGLREVSEDAVLARTTCACA